MGAWGMKPDLIALVLALTTWTGWAILESSFKHNTPVEKNNLVIWLLMGYIRSWWVFLIVWWLYLSFMWLVHDHPPWPLEFN